MKILGIDTSSQNASVAILEDEKVIIELNNADEKTHSQKLMPMIDEAFQKTNLTLQDIALIACGVGPGSFTGIRIGIATAKAFADSRNLPVVAVNSLEGLAYHLQQEGTICSCIDAKNGNVYCGLFVMKKSPTGLLEVAKQDLTFLSFFSEKNEPSTENLFSFLNKNEAFFEKETSIYFVGDGSVVYHDLIETLSFQKKFLFAKETSASGISISQIGYTKYQKGEFGNSDVLVPVYLRKSQAEIAMLKK